MLVPGFIIGSFLSGLLYDRCSRLWLTLATTVGAGVCTLMTPYMTSLTGMLALRVASGLFCGALDTGANTIVSSIWESDSGPYMQALYLSYTVGGIVAPFVTRPFMSSENEKHTGGHLNGDEKGIDDHTRVVSLTNSQLTSNNYSNISQRLYSRFESEAMNISQFSQESSMLFERTSQIHYAFIVTGVLAFMSSFPYLAMIVSGRFSSKSKPRRCEITVSGDQESLTDDSLTHTESRDVTLKRPDHRNKCLLLVCLAAINILYNAVEDSFGDFVITFCLEYLQWSNTQSVALLSLYWLASCIGGLTGILLVRVIGSGRLLAVMHVGWILTFGLASLGSVFRIHALIWFSMPASGFFMVQIIPAVFSWTAENVCPVTGKVSSLFLIATGVGIAGNPSVIGYLMERFTFVSFVYVLTGEAILCAVCNFLALLIASRQSSGRGPYPPTKA
ncbi:sodium-dependent glucose transporter 1C-like [Dreissena polymorpha]|uniref:Uncharacterized protein n=1 Tax=Dreissena polymorpha TaxID=45954 RepID=A0A9D4EFX2_DREPO|nr:sodium-dependent glucose transporter 1C-like [Dreissena polymorpha]KAH3778765.1 hypothetical protein DPMN_180236 [Dreissena polymorpha]